MYLFGLSLCVKKLEEDIRDFMEQESLAIVNLPV